MTSSHPSAINDVQRAVHENGTLLLIQGVLMMVLGVAAVIWPQISTIAVDYYVGWLFLLSGLMGLVTMFLAPSVSSFLWSLLTSALALFVGILLLWHPVAGAVSLTLVLVGFFLVEGIFQIAAAISYRDTFPNAWGWMAVSGVADLILVGIIISGWPGTATWALGLIVAVNLITSGLAIAVVGMTARNA